MLEKPESVFTDDGDLHVSGKPAIRTHRRRYHQLILVISALSIVLWVLHTLNGSTRHDGPHLNSYPDSWIVSLYASIARDPLGEPLGYPTLNPNTSHLHLGSHAMIASDVPICSQMGVGILRKGGSAADAAVTVALCIGSVNLHSSGIGGGSFITSSYEGEVLSFDAREMAPGASFKDMYEGREILSKLGGLAVAVPGELKGLHELFVRHGSGNLTWYELFEPVIELNRNGFPVSKVLSNALTSSAKLFPELEKTGLLDSWDFLFKDKKTLKFVEEGDIIKRENLAQTLEFIGRSGSSDVFYDPEGPIVESMLEEVHRQGGWITKKDFDDYQIRVEPALKFEFKTSSASGKGSEREQPSSYTVFTSSGASSGLGLIAGLNFFFNLQNKCPSKDQVVQTHRVIETMKWMASARSNFGDFHVYDGIDNVTFREHLISKFSSLDWSLHIIENKHSDERTFPWQHYEPKYELTEPHGTSHFSIVDEQGNAVGMTTTVNLLFGSLVYDNRTGIILNNEMDDFSVPNVPNAFNLTPSIYNFIEPKKRPLSSTSPTIVMSERIQDDGTSKLVPSLVIGAAGGSRITTAILQAIINIYFEDIDLLQAISYPRLHHQLIPEFAMCENYEVFEDRYENIEIIEALRKLGHELYQTGPMTVMNGIARKDTRELEIEYQWEGVSDYWRKLGEASGY